MSTKTNVHIVVEITHTDQRKLDFDQHEVTGRQIKEAAKLPLDTELAVDREDGFDSIANEEKLTIRDGERFVVIHKDIVLIVNGREKVWHEKHISFRQVVELAYGSDAFKNPDIIYRVTYTHGPKKNPKGTVVDGDTVHVKPGMIFNATPTNRS